MKMFVFWFEFHWSLIPKGLIGNMSALFRVMALRRTGEKPLTEPMLTQFIDAYMRHKEEMS